VEEQSGLNEKLQDNMQRKLTPKNSLGSQRNNKEQKLSAQYWNGSNGFLAK
jgi:hypothetical protein